MKFEFQNSIVKLSFFCHIMDIRIAQLNKYILYVCMYIYIYIYIYMFLNF